MRGTATAVYNACLLGADQVYRSCMGGCLLPNGQPKPTTVCAARRFACKRIYSIEVAICDAVYLGLVAAADLYEQTCSANCRKKHAKPFPGPNCPPGWSPFDRDWGPIDDTLGTALAVY